MNKTNRISSLRLSMLLIALFSISSCDDAACDEILERLVSLGCVESKCDLDLRKLFIKDWDQLYIFHGFNTPEDISSAIGLQYNGEAIYDHQRLILEIANKEILMETRTECLELNFDRLIKMDISRKIETNHL